MTKAERKPTNLGPMNGHSAGIVFKEMVRRATVAIRNERFNFEQQEKMGYTGELNDVVTSADKAAQAIYVKLIHENFPGVGIVAEEDQLREPCTIPGINAFITVDPLDGTKAFVRGQSHGVGTMVSLVVDAEVISAFIGDINTQEIYYYRPDSESVHRLNEFERSMVLTAPVKPTLAEQYALLRSHPSKYEPLFQKLVDYSFDNPNCAVREIEISGGSIGIQMARLWKQEVGMVMLNKGMSTPWDWAPVYGISKKLGYAFLQNNIEGLVEIDLGVSAEITENHSDTIIVHKKYVDELKMVAHR